MFDRTVTEGPQRRRISWIDTVILYAMAVGGLAVAGALYAMVANNVALAKFDFPLAAWCSRHVNGAAISGMLIVTQLGSTVVIVGIAAAVATVERKRGFGKGVVRYVVVTVGGEVVITNVTKLIFRRDRPQLLQLVVTSSHRIRHARFYILDRSKTGLLREVVEGSARCRQ
jgi:hypothetical protein